MNTRLEPPSQAKARVPRPDIGNRVRTEVAAFLLLEADMPIDVQPRHQEAAVADTERVAVLVDDLGLGCLQVLYDRRRQRDDDATRPGDNLGQSAELRGCRTIRIVRMAIASRERRWKSSAHHRRTPKSLNSPAAGDSRMCVLCT